MGLQHPAQNPLRLPSGPMLILPLIFFDLLPLPITAPDERFCPCSASPLDEPCVFLAFSLPLWSAVLDGASMSPSWLELGFH